MKQVSGAHCNNWQPNRIWQNPSSIAGYTFFTPWKSTPRSRSPCITQLTLGAPYITGQSALSREGGRRGGREKQECFSACLPGRLICIQQHTRPFFTERFITRLMSGEQLLTIGRLSFTHSAVWSLFGAIYCRIFYTAKSIKTTTLSLVWSLPITLKLLTRQRCDNICFIDFSYSWKLGNVHVARSDTTAR